MKRVITEMQQFTDAITENRNNALDNIQHGKQEAANTHTSLKKITTQHSKTEQQHQIKTQKQNRSLPNARVAYPMTKAWEHEWESYLEHLAVNRTSGMYFLNSQRIITILTSQMKIFCKL